MPEYLRLGIYFALLNGVVLDFSKLTHELFCEADFFTAVLAGTGRTDLRDNLAFAPFCGTSDYFTSSGTCHFRPPC